MSKLDDIYANLQKAEDSKQENSGGGNRDYLKPKPGNTYLVRLLPYIEDVSKTFVEFDFHGWNSTKDGSYVTTGACPRTWGNNCSICQEGFATYQAKTLHNGELKSKLLLKRTTRLVNVYVIDDPVNPENNGTVKVIRYGNQLHELIDGAVFGENKEEYGRAVFDLTNTGVTFKIMVERKGDSKKSPPSYVKSNFVRSAGKIDLTQDEIDIAYAAAKDLTSLIPKTKSDEEIEKILAEHFRGAPQPLGGDSMDEPEREANAVTNDMIPTQTSESSGNTPADAGEIDATVTNLLDSLD